MADAWGQVWSQSRHAEVGSPEQRDELPYSALKTKQSSVVKTPRCYYPTSSCRGFRYVETSEGYIALRRILLNERKDNRENIFIYQKNYQSYEL